MKLDGIFAHLPLETALQQLLSLKSISLRGLSQEALGSQMQM